MPVTVEVRTSLATVPPEAPSTRMTLATTPELSLAPLMASRTPASVPWAASTATEKEFPPTEIVSVPVPTPALALS